jgi:hypothetical protein
VYVESRGVQARTGGKGLVARQYESNALRNGIHVVPTTALVILGRGTGCESQKWKDTHNCLNTSREGESGCAWRFLLVKIIIK